MKYSTYITRSQVYILSDDWKSNMSAIILYIYIYIYLVEFLCGTWIQQKRIACAEKRKKKTSLPAVC